MLKDAFTYTVGENIIGAPQMHTFFGTLSFCKLIQYLDSNKALFSIAPHLFNDLPTLFHFLYRFCRLVHGFLYVLPPI